MHTPAFDLELCRLSAESYEHHSFAAGNVEALYSITDARRVLAFTGTKFNFSDILADLRTVPWWNSDLGWCHKGIMIGVRDDFWPRFWSHVLSYSPRTPLWITGHSKGGGAALVFGAMARAVGAPIAGIVTFGAPMVMGSRGKRLLWDVPVRQYRSGADIVPTVPALLGALGVLGHVRDLIRVGTASEDKDGPFTDHRNADYLGVMGARVAAQAAP